MISENDERIEDYWKIGYGSYIVKLIDDKGLEDEVKEVDTMPLLWGAFALSNSKRILNNLIHFSDGFYTNDVFLQIWTHYTIKINTGIKKDKAGLIGKIFLEGKNDYKDGGIFYGLYVAPKTKFFFNYKYIWSYIWTWNF